MVQMTPTVLKKLVLLIQEGVPIRQKNFHLINVPSAFMSIYNLGRSLVNDKLRKRVGSKSST
jgi:CRAL/TRIO domain